MTCYINSTLQSLLTLSCFVQEVHNQLLLWSSNPKLQIYREFVEVGVCRSSNMKKRKKMSLSSFKRAVAMVNSNFQGDKQNDAHEFLLCVLDMLKSPESGWNYTCPVRDHIALELLSTRTCRGCGEQSLMLEEFLSLSLDLVPEGSVSRCLQEYLKESKLEYMCECGAKKSFLKRSFFTLPNVLILHLKRFRLTKTLRVKKVESPIKLTEELVLNEEFMTTEDTTARYSLVSIISHVGSTADSGHYISDGVYRNKDMGDVTDCWLTYDDEDVSPTTGASVCQKRATTAFLLFYEKQH
ncbi:ubiquitin carboxyl-terminal hydrolase 37 [Kryptolebias marmoratus]|uniref:ubiquitin carboxyl-terminal hydrolase 37 n=1 Tax=Kryptolebias marmoratus TaxID=37003 RepID=UPI0007F8FC5D|nr:ubiquitin carboxyl-terminal hydrolase 37 [Kryptolebias marmoratus]